MALPDLIEIVPLVNPRPATVTVPGSKSITNRALILAALAKGTVALRGALWSEDTQVMTECLRELGFTVSVDLDPAESGNRVIRVEGRGGEIPRAGTAEKPLELFVGNAGTAARFLTALVCLGKGVYRLHGIPRMHERPQAALMQALRQLGYNIQSANNKLPVVVYGQGPRAGKCQVTVDESSQFASALLLSGRIGEWQVEITGANTEELPYVEMTRKLIEAFPYTGGEFQIEPDASSGSYFWGAGWLLGVNATVANWPTSGWQIDQTFPGRMNSMKTWAGEKPVPRSISELEPGNLPFQSISRERDLGDSIMTVIVLASFCELDLEFTDLGRLRVQECERVVALRTELTKCGAQVVETGDTLEVFPGKLHGSEIETYNDHRMAMCFAILGLKAGGIKIKNPACVKKTFPNFFQKLAAAAPAGLGATIRDARDGRVLTGDDLFAE